MVSAPNCGRSPEVFNSSRTNNMYMYPEVWKTLTTAHSSQEYEHQQRNSHANNIMLINASNTLQRCHSDPEAYIRMHHQNDINNDMNTDSSSATVHNTSFSSSVNNHGSLEEFYHDYTRNFGPENDQMLAEEEDHHHHHQNGIGTNKMDNNLNISNTVSCQNNTSTNMLTSLHMGAHAMEMKYNNFQCDTSNKRKCEFDCDERMQTKWGKLGEENSTRIHHNFPNSSMF